MARICLNLSSHPETVMKRNPVHSYGGAFLTKRWLNVSVQYSRGGEQRKGKRGRKLGVEDEHYSKLFCRSLALLYK